MEKWKVTPGVYALVYLHKVVNLRNTSKAAFWSEPCTPNLHSKETHLNRWETGRKEKTHLYESHSKRVLHHSVFEMKSRQKHQAGAYLRGL